MKKATFVRGSPFFVQAIQASFAANRRNSGCAQSVPYFGERGP